MLQEVMAEVDDDQSSTLDFYEYLKVSVLIIQKTGKHPSHDLCLDFSWSHAASHTTYNLVIDLGKSLMLQDEEVTKNKKTLSKTCMIQ